MVLKAFRVKMSPLLIFRSFRNATAIAIVHEIYYKLFQNFDSGTFHFVAFISHRFIWLMSRKEFVLLLCWSRYCSRHSRLCDIQLAQHSTCRIDRMRRLFIKSIGTQWTPLLIMITHQIQSSNRFYLQKTKLKIERILGEISSNNEAHLVRERSNTP